MTDPNLNHPTPGQYGPPSGAPPITDEHANVTPQQLYQLLKASGFSPVEAAAFTMIAQRESGFRPTAFNGNTGTGDQSYGLFQINLLNGGWGPFLQSALGWSSGQVAANLSTTSGSVAAVRAIYQHSGMTPWGGYKGVSWNHGTNIATGVAASGGEVTEQQLTSFNGFDAAGNNGGLGTSGSGGGGGGFGGGTGSPRDTAAILAQWGWLINDPDVGPLIRQAESPTGMTQDEFTQKLQETPWYRHHSDTSRQWLALWNEDPASARQQLANNALTIRSTAQELGINLPDVTLAALGYQASQYGWTTQQMTMAIFGAFKVNANMGGGFGAGVTSARQTAADYGIRLSDSAATNYETQIAEGLIDPQTLQGNFQKQAEALFPTVAPLLQQGQTVRSIIEPYMQNAATTLGVDASGFDPTDPKWLAPLQAKDGKGNPTQLSLSDWSTKVMSDPVYAYDQTDNARNAAFNLGASFAQTFGVSA